MQLLKMGTEAKEKARVSENAPYSFSCIQKSYLMKKPKKCIEQDREKERA
jgi:hypothetical protein